MDEMYSAMPGSPITYLAGDISAGQTTIAVADDTALPDAPNICTIGYGEHIETIRYGAKSNGVLQDVTRGIEGTPRAWQSGTEVARFYTAYDHNAIIQTIMTHEAETATQTKLGHIKLQEPWIDAVLQNGWTGTLQYAKNDLGQLVIKGFIKGGTMSVNTIIATLPSGYHTNYRAILMAQVVQTANGVPLLYMNNASGYLRLVSNHGVVADQDCHIFAILDIN